MGFHARDWRYDQVQRRWPASIHIEQYHRTQEHEERLRLEAFAELQRYKAMDGQVTNTAFHSSFANLSGPTIADSWKTRTWFREPFRAPSNVAFGSNYLSFSEATLAPGLGNVVEGAVDGPRNSYRQILEQEKQGLVAESVDGPTISYRQMLEQEKQGLVGGSVDGPRISYRQLLEQEKQRLGMVDNNRAAEKSKPSSAPKPSLAKWRELYEQVKNPERQSEEKRLLSEIEYTQRKFDALKLTRQKSLLFAEPAKPEKEIEGAFEPLSAEAEERVEDALTSSDRHKVLVMHENSNIDISGIVIRCLLPGAWLNDEVINLYMELLKERELREPHRFLKCHFFNTFFYNKLFKDKQRYDYKAVRRWTTQRKIGYLLSDCDKILVPVHQDIHWCLAVINIRGKKVEYLDSLKGGDPNVLRVLSQYLVDEVKDKSGQDIDVTSWELSYPDDIPQQLNGCDCGMFMLKYADFHSRGASLCFTQKHMDYFRKKTAWEILQLAAT